MHVPITPFLQILHPKNVHSTVNKHSIFFPFDLDIDNGEVELEPQTCDKTPQRMLLKLWLILKVLKSCMNKIYHSKNYCTGITT